MKTNFGMALTLLVGVGIGAATVQGLHAQAKPPAYVITEVEIINEEAFKEFAPKVDATMAPFGGKRLVRGGKIVAMEGEAPKRVGASGPMGGGQFWTPPNGRGPSVRGRTPKT